MPKFNKPGKKLHTKNGFFVNYHGICFFVTHDFEYNLWVKTRKSGVLPLTNEYGRLKNELKLTQSDLTKEQEEKASKIAAALAENPLMGLTPDELTAIEVYQNRLAEEDGEANAQEWKNFDNRVHARENLAGHIPAGLREKFAD